MNEQDKEAFEKWTETKKAYFDAYHHDIKEDCEDAWQAALEYRDEQHKDAVITYKAMFEQTKVKAEELEEKLALTESWVKHHQNSVTIAMKDRRELEEKLAVAEKNSADRFYLSLKAEQKLSIAIEALEKTDKKLSLTFYTFEPIRQSIKEALEKIKR